MHPQKASARSRDAWEASYSLIRPLTTLENKPNKPRHNKPRHNKPNKPRVRVVRVVLSRELGARSQEPGVLRAFLGHLGAGRQEPGATREQPLGPHASP